MESVESVNEEENVFCEDNIGAFIKCFEKKCFEGEQKYFCRLSDKCKAMYTAKSSAIRHLKTNHSETYNVIKKRKIKKDNSDSTNELELRVKVNVSDIWDACVDLIAFRSLPLNVLEGDAFQKLLRPYKIALESKGIVLSVTAESMKKKLSERASEIKEKIKAEAKDKFFGVMIDIASRYSRSVLGVSISYILNDSIVIRTIGMHTIRMSQRSKDLFEIIETNLNEFDLNVDHIISFTTDNGKNMTKTASLFDEIQKEMHNESLMNCQALLENFDSDEEMDEDIFDEKYYDDLLNAIRKEFEIVLNPSHFVHGIRCSSHCLHLVITHAIKKSPQIQSFLDKVRTLLKKLRTPKYRNLLKSQGLNIPTLDVITRWNSVYEMVFVILL